jgi:branched-chain amino acid aminotransferase
MSTSDPSQWRVKSLRLQRPEHIYFGGRVRPWHEATLHVATESVVRGINVFEGIKGYWHPDGQFRLRALRQHHDRLQRSARLLHIPAEFSYEDFERACFEMAKAELRPDKDLYIRATLFIVEGHYHEGNVSDLNLTAYQQSQQLSPPIDVGISTWRRSPDVSMPARIKSSANYQISRLARIEGKGRGYEEMILLNQSGRVAEGIGACVLLVRDGVVSSPPASEGALESITLAIVEDLADSMGIPFERRPIDRTELYLASELGLTGTLSDVSLIRSIDEMALPEHMPLLTALRDRYVDAVRGTDPHPRVEFSVVPR